MAFIKQPFQPNWCCGFYSDDAADILRVTIGFARPAWDGVNKASLVNLIGVKPSGTGWTANSQYVSGCGGWAGNGFIEAMQSTSDANYYYHVYFIHLNNIASVIPVGGNTWPWWVSGQTATIEACTASLIADGGAGRACAVKADWVDQSYAVTVANCIPQTSFACWQSTGGVCFGPSTTSRARFSVGCTSNRPSFTLIDAT